MQTRVQVGFFFSDSGFPFKLNPASLRRLHFKEEELAVCCAYIDRLHYASGFNSDIGWSNIPVPNSSSSYFYLSLKFISSPSFPKARAVWCLSVPPIKEFVFGFSSFSGARDMKLQGNGAFSSFNGPLIYSFLEPALKAKKSSSKTAENKEFRFLPLKKGGELSRRFSHDALWYCIEYK